MEVWRSSSSPRISNLFNICALCICHMLKISWMISFTINHSCVEWTWGVNIWCLFRHVSKSYFFPRCSFLLSERDSGYLLFSCLKKILMSVSLSWATMYILSEQRLTPACKFAILPDCFDLFFGIGHLNNWKEFFLIGSWIDQVHSTKTDWW